MNALWKSACWGVVCAVAGWVHSAQAQAAAPAPAQLDCRQAVSTPDMNACAARAQQAVEAQLNARYQALMRELDGKAPGSEADPQLKQAVVLAQRAWVQFREADCKAVYQQYSGGTIRSLMHIGCMQMHAEQRIKALAEFSAQ